MCRNHVFGENGDKLRLFLLLKWSSRYQNVKSHVAIEVRREVCDSVRSTRYILASIIESFSSFAFVALNAEITSPYWFRTSSLWDDPVLKRVEWGLFGKIEYTRGTVTLRRRGVETHLDDTMGDQVSKTSISENLGCEPRNAITLLSRSLLFIFLSLFFEWGQITLISIAHTRSTCFYRTYCPLHRYVQKSEGSFVVFTRTIWIWRWSIFPVRSFW